MAHADVRNGMLPAGLYLQSDRLGLLQSAWPRFLLWLAVATSSVVFVEPALYDILVIALACGLFSMGLSVPRSLGPATLLLALFLIGNLAGALSSGFSPAGFRSLSIRIYMVLAWLLFACLIAHNPRYFIRTIWSGYIIAAGIAVCWGIGQYYGLISGEFAGPAHRATGGFKDANVFAPFLVPVALLAVAHLFRARGVTLALTFGWFLLLVLGILLAFSRGAWLNFLASCGFLSTLLIVGTSSYRQKLSFALMLIVLGFAGFGALFWTVNYTAAGELFAERTTLVQAYDVAAGGRFAAQISALEAIGRTPFGIGPAMSDAVVGLAPHNVYLHVTLEAGWLGGLSIYAFLLLGLWRGIRQLRATDGELKIHLLVVLASVLGVLLQSFFIDSTHWRHLWLLLAMLWGLTAAQHRPGQVTR